MKTQHFSIRFAIRKALFTTVAVFAVALTQVSLAAEGPKPKAGAIQSAIFRIPNSLKFRAIVTNCEGKFSVTIRNNSRTPVYNEVLANGGDYMRTFDLSMMEDGEYTFEISNGEQTTKKTFTIGTTMARVVSVNQK